MTNYIRHCLWAACIVALMAGSAHALGVGMYGFAGMARGDANVAPFRAGVLLDTDPAADNLLNFRYQIGYGTTMQNEDMYASLGFGIVRTGLLRFWLGPQIGMSFKRNDTWPMLVWGAVAGLNIHLGGHLYAGIDCGLRYIVILHDNDGDPVGWRKPEPFAGISVLFRFNESYHGAVDGVDDAPPQQAITAE